MSINLQKLDPPPLQNDKLSPDLQNWLSNLTDQINQMTITTENAINNIVINKTADIGGAGAGPISVAVSGMDANSIVVATIVSSTNTVAVAKCVATASGFNITFTGDPGASCIVSYSIGIAAQ